MPALHALQFRAPKEQQKEPLSSIYARNHPVGLRLATGAEAEAEALVGVLAGVDPLAVDVDGLRERVGAGEVARAADAARRPGDPFLAVDVAPDGLGVVAERAGELRVQLRLLLGRRHRLGGPRLPLPHGGLMVALKQATKDPTLKDDDETRDGVLLRPREKRLLVETPAGRGSEGRNGDAMSSVGLGCRGDDLMVDTIYVYGGANASGKRAAR